MRSISLKLTARSDGRFAKRIDGEYFVWPDEKTARAEILEIARRREHGSDDTTIAATPHDPPLRVIANLFRTERKPHVAPGTWADYETAIDQFLAMIGKHRVATALKPDDFARVRAKWDETLGPWKLDNRIQAIRTMFKWAAETARVIERQPWYGDAFKKTSPADKRRVKRESVAENGERRFTRDELRAMLKATGPLKAFILLGLNGGMYAKDISDLCRWDLKREGKHWLIDNDRAKTLVRRKFVLWPETIAAIQKHRDSGDRLFSTVHGNAWVQGETDSIGLLFRRLLDDKGIKRGGVGFGALRHTHVTAVSAHPDRNAASVVRGHKVFGISEHYDFPDLKRLKAITDLARSKLFTISLRPSRKPAASGARRASAA